MVVLSAAVLLLVVGGMRIVVLEDLLLIEAMLLQIVEDQVPAHVLGSSIANSRHSDLAFFGKFLDLRLQFAYLLLQILDVLLISPSSILALSNIPVRTTLILLITRLLLKLHLLNQLLLPGNLQL